MDIDPLELDRIDLHGDSIARRKKGLFFIALAVGAAGFAMSIQGNANANFITQEMGLTVLQQGALEGIRESCGIVALGILAILAGFSEPVIGAAMLLMLGVGLGSYLGVPSYPWLIGANIVWSQGFHVWMPLPNSMTLALAEPGNAGRRLGQVSAAGSIGAGTALLAAWALTFSHVPIRWLYLMAGAAGVIAAFACLGIPRGIKGKRPKLIFRKRYGLYYLLCFLEGWRKQVYIAFAGFYLVSRFGLQLETMLFLGMAIQAIGWFASPRVGRLIDRIGERKILLAYFIGLTFFFVCYALIDDMYVLFALYVIDGSFFLLGMALPSYVNRLAPKEEHTATLSMGVAANHVASVAMPLLAILMLGSKGGKQAFVQEGYRWVFLLGATAAALSILAVLRLPKRPALSPSTPT